MQYVKKISAILLIWFMMIAVGSAKQIEQKEITSYTFSYYTSFLNAVLVPDIETYIDEFKVLPYNKEKGKELIKGVINLIQGHLTALNMLVPPGQKYPVSLIVMPPDKNLNVVYYLNIVLPLVEYNQVGKITSILLISKNFFCGMESLVVKEKA